MKADPLPLSPRKATLTSSALPPLLVALPPLPPLPPLLALLPPSPPWPLAVLAPVESAEEASVPLVSEPHAVPKHAPPAAKVTTKNH